MYVYRQEKFKIICQVNLSFPVNDILWMTLLWMMLFMNDIIYKWLSFMSELITYRLFALHHHWPALCLALALLPGLCVDIFHPGSPQTFLATRKLFWQHTNFSGNAQTFQRFAANVKIVLFKSKALYNCLNWGRFCLKNDTFRLVVAILVNGHISTGILTWKAQNICQITRGNASI